jgi:hypothetical protein
MRARRHCLLAAALVAAGCGGSSRTAAINPDDAGAGASSDATDAAPPMGGLPPGLKVILVTNGTPALSAGDTVMVDRLHSRGFVVTFTTDVAATADVVAGQDLIVISSSAESGPLGTKIRDVAIPVLCIENGAFPTMGLSGTTLATDYGSTFNQTMVTIADGAPPLAGGLGGSVTISATPAELGWAQPAASAVTAATMAGDPTHAMLFGYPAGAAMPGLVAPARRVGFAIRETAAANLTDDGLALFDAAVTYALAN